MNRGDTYRGLYEQGWYTCYCIFTLYNKWGRNEMTAILLYSSLSLKII